MVKRLLLLLGGESRLVDGKWWIKNLGLGLLFGLAFVMLNFVSGFSLLLPVFKLSLAENLRFIVVGILAPIGEEVFFCAGFLLLFRFTRNNYFLSIIIVSVVFGLYHLLVYNAQIGSMISAMAFRAIACLILVFRKTDWSFTSPAFVGGVISIIVMHMTFNIYLLGKAGLFVVGI